MCLTIESWRCVWLLPWYSVTAAIVQSDLCPLLPVYLASALSPLSALMSICFPHCHLSHFWHTCRAWHHVSCVNCQAYCVRPLVGLLLTHVQFSCPMYPIQYCYMYLKDPLMLSESMKCKLPCVQQRVTVYWVHKADTLPCVLCNGKLSCIVAYLKS